jgi:chemotaxis protein CheD
LLPLPAGQDFKKAWIGPSNKIVDRMVLANQQIEIRAMFAMPSFEPMAPCITITANASQTVEEVRVDMADMKIESKHVELLTSVGSCVAICLHDSVHKCGGLAHIMLPNSAQGLQEPLPSKFANTAVPALVKEIHAIAGNPIRLSAKIAGGANMFANLGINHLDIGAKNVKAVKTALDEHKIRLAGEDVGGVHGRRVTFDVASGRTIVRQHNGAIKEL